MKQPTITEISHLLMGDYLTRDMITVDMTIGNGHDTLFMAQRVKKVYGFDIQRQAIINTKELTKDYDNVILFEDSHDNILNHIKEEIDLVIFNFGYLPNGDKSIMTMPESSLKAVKDSLSILKDNGWLVLCFYPHPQGEIEKEVILDYLSNGNFLLSSYTTHLAQSPSLYLVTKK